MLLTAIHFHFAGFGCLLVVGLLGRLLGTRRTWAPRAWRLYPAVAVGLMGAFPLLAAGIAGQRALEVLGVTLYVLLLPLLAGLLLVGADGPALLRAPRAAGGPRPHGPRGRLLRVRTSRLRAARGGPGGPALLCAHRGLHVVGRPGLEAGLPARRPAVGVGSPIYVAAYSSHVLGEMRYMNIAFPLPFSNMTSILRLDHDAPGGTGLRLTSCAREEAPGGDQGVYLANRVLSLRLPLNEIIWVWSAEGTPRTEPPCEDPAVVLRARHEMWFLGMKYLELHYFIERVGEAGPG